MDFNDHQLAQYMREISMHGQGAQLAYQALGSLVVNPNTRQSQSVWLYLTLFLHHASMISKFLWPATKKGLAGERGRVLRSVLGVGDSSEVLSRDARDNVEHFDERMDRWAEDGKSALLEIVLDDRDDYEYLRITEKRVKRLLIADEMVFVSEGRDNSKFEFRLRPAHQDVVRIQGKADDWIRTSAPYKYVYPRNGG